MLKQYTWGSWPRRVLAYGGAMLVCAGSAMAQAPVVRITTSLSPDGPVYRSPVELVITVESSQPLTGARLLLAAPEGLKLQALPDSAAAGTKPSTGGTHLLLPLHAFAGRTSRAIIVTPDVGKLRRATYRVLADVYAADSAGRPPLALAHEPIPIAVVPQIALASYLWLGLVGILIGYLIRLVIKVLGAVPAPLPAPPETNDPTTGPITRFVTRHYYFTDFTVTCVMGVLLMLLLLKDAHLPDNAGSWYGAMILGFSLGLLTNSDLVTKFRLPG